MVKSSYSGADEKKKKQKKTVNGVQEKYFQYVATVALNHIETKINSERILKIKLFIDKYKWTDINYPSGKDDCLHFKTQLTYILLAFQNATQNVKNKLFSQLFQTKKDPIIV